MTWRRDDIDLGQRFTMEDGSSIWEVIAITDRPTVVLRPVSMSGAAIGGSPELHFVIDSEDFGRWRKVRLEGPGRD